MVSKATKEGLMGTTESESEWGVYAQSASKAIFRARTHNRITYSVR